MGDCEISKYVFMGIKFCSETVLKVILPFQIAFLVELLILLFKDTSFILC